MVIKWPGQAVGESGSGLTPPSALLAVGLCSEARLEEGLLLWAGASATLSHSPLEDGSKGGSAEGHSVSGEKGAAQPSPRA